MARLRTALPRAHLLRGGEQRARAARATERLQHLVQVVPLLVAPVAPPLVPLAAAAAEAERAGVLVELREEHVDLAALEARDRLVRLEPDVVLQVRLVLLALAAAAAAALALARRVGRRRVLRLRVLGALLGGSGLADDALLGALALAHLRVVSVLDRVVRPPHEALRDLRPLGTQLVDAHDDERVLLDGPVALLDLGADLVLPALAALLSSPPLDQLGDLGPVPLAKLGHGLCELLIHLDRPLRAEHLARLDSRRRQSAPIVHDQHAAPRRQCARIRGAAIRGALQLHRQTQFVGLGNLGDSERSWLPRSCTGSNVAHGHVPHRLWRQRRHVQPEAVLHGCPTPLLGARLGGEFCCFWLPLGARPIRNYLRDKQPTGRRGVERGGFWEVLV